MKINLNLLLVVLQRIKSHFRSVLEANTYLLSLGHCPSEALVRQRPARGGEGGSALFALQSRSEQDDNPPAGKLIGMRLQAPIQLL